MSGFNFKSAGKKINNRKFTNIPASFTQLQPIGIKTPLQIKPGSGDLYETHSAPEDQLKDNLKNFLLTNNGERLGRYNYGANLSQYLFELTSLENFESQLVEQVVNKVRKNFSGITLTNTEVFLLEGKIQNKKALDQLHFYNKQFDNKDRKINEYRAGESIAKIKIVVEFAIPSLNIKNQKVEAILFAGG